MVRKSNERPILQIMTIRLSFYVLRMRQDESLTDIWKPCQVESLTFIKIMSG
jgi:hypothetical protein